jgi:hypothetical protein
MIATLLMVDLGGHNTNRPVTFAGPIIGIK